MSGRDWTETKVAGVGIIWISAYLIEMDALIGLPIWQGSTAAARALDRGIIHEISRERAQELNTIFAADKWEGAIGFLEERLAERWAVIARQVAEAPSCQD